MTWAERRAHDLFVSHRLAEYFDGDDMREAKRLIGKLVALEALENKTIAQGGDAHDLEAIEAHAWPVRESLRILDRQNLLPKPHPRLGVPDYLLA